MNLLIISLIYLSVLRLMYLPFAGSNSHWVSAIFSILLAGIMFVFFKIDKSKVIIICYSLILYILNLVSFGTSLDLKIVSYFETITPFILLGSVTSKRFLDYLRNNIKFFKNALIILILILLFGSVTFSGLPSRVSISIFDLICTYGSIPTLLIAINLTIILTFYLFEKLTFKNFMISFLFTIFLGSFTSLIKSFKIIILLSFMAGEKLLLNNRNNKF